MKTLSTPCICFLFFLSTSFFFTTQSTATVGGPQILEIIGFDAQQNSVVFVRHKNDAEGLPPQLWAYRLGLGEIEVMADATKYYNNGPITKGITPLKKMDVITDKMLKVNWHPPVEVNDTILQFEYTLFPAKVQLADHQFDIVQCFKKDKPIEVAEQYYFEQSDLVFVIFRYLGVCFETGYMKDTLLVSTMSAIQNIEKEQSEDTPTAMDTLAENENTPTSTETEPIETDYSLLWTLSIMILLAVVYLWLRLKSGRNRVGKRRR
ncbi:MAG: hypothetical protein R3E32_24880 [Chitinophagales bacterium]